MKLRREIVGGKKKRERVILFAVFEARLGLNI